MDSKKLFPILSTLQTSQAGGAAGDVARGAAAAAPGCGRDEELRSSPPALTGGESFSPSLQKSRIDWLTATWQPESPDIAIWMDVVEVLRSIMGPNVTGITCPGILGYAFGFRIHMRIMDKEIFIGRVDWGGNHHKQRARLDITGTGCSRITNYAPLARWLANECFDLKLTRVDLAVDCLNGEITVDDAVEWWKSGDFGTGGRRPSHSTVGAWLATDSSELDKGEGRTLEIGKRRNGKMLRAYEKGRQLGDPDSPWVRFEVEFRNIDRELPLDILTSPDKYFAGAYKCLQRVLGCASERIATEQRQGEISLDKLKEHLRTSYGKCLNVLRFRMSAEEIIDELSLNGVPVRLERAAVAGVLSCHAPARSHYAHANHWI